MNSKISIIIPFYNSSKTIRKCIESVINQTYINFEAIFVNDGGTDSSEEIIKEYMRNDKRIKLISHIKNKGVSAARNTGILNSTGDYIEFLDSDDYLDPLILEKMLSASKKYDADIVVCNYSHPSIKNYLGNKIINSKNKFELLNYYQTTFAAVVPWNKLYKKEIIKTLFDESVSFCEDELFGLANIFNSNKIVGIDDVLYHYYVAPKDVSLEESSCINKMAKASDFWITKETYWYKRREILDKTKEVLLKNLDKEEIDDFAYARMFDFMIWELLIFNQIGVDKYGLLCEMKNIFKEKEFIKSICIREKYGLDYICYDNKMLDSLIEDYIDSCLEIVNDVEKNKLDLKPFYLCLNLFVKMFIKRNNYEIDTNDIMANSYYELDTNSTSEAKYINNWYTKK